MAANVKKPGAGRRRVSDAIAGLGALYGKSETTRIRKGRQSPRMPHNWRDRAPDPVAYYGARIGKLSRPNAAGWAQGACPFHEDREASFSVNLAGLRGCWKCFAGCGTGDMVAFQMRLSGCDFKQAVVELVRGGA